MTLAGCLAVYGVVASWLLPRALLRHTRLHDSPGLGAFAWLAAVLSVVLAWVAAAGLVLAEMLVDSGRTGEFLDACLAAVTGDADGWQVVVAAFALGVSAIVPAVGLLGCRMGRVLLSTSRARAKLDRAVAVLGRPSPRLGPGVLLVESRKAEAYCTSGGVVVVTTAAVRDLRADELAAVLAHERAHMARHHHVLLGFLGALHRAAPRVPLFAAAPGATATLLEMCADDRATRQCSRRSLASALLTMSTAPAPQPALGAGGGVVLARARRLLAPPTVRARMKARLALTVPAAIVTLSAAGALVGMVADACATVFA